MLDSGDFDQFAQVILEKTIIKLGSLLALGFGEVSPVGPADPANCG